MLKRKKIILVSCLITVFVVGIIGITVFGSDSESNGKSSEEQVNVEPLIPPSEAQEIFTKIEDKNSDGERDILDMIITIKNNEWNDLQ